MNGSGLDSNNDDSCVERSHQQNFDHSADVRSTFRCTYDHNVQRSMSTDSDLCSE